MATVVRLLLVAVVVTAAAVGVGYLLWDREPTAAPEEAAPSVPLADLDTASLTVPRAAFCEAVPDASAEAALDGGIAEAGAYANGDDVTLADGTADVAHELGCAWTAEDGTSAAAWVFAPPITGERAQQLVDAAAAACAPVEGAAAFGAPSVATLCRADGTRTVTWQGLFGDAWTTCRISSPDAAIAREELVERADRWCSAVLTAAS